MQELWDIEVLKLTHSTQQEMANGNASLAAVLRDAPPGIDIVEVYDSQATVHIARRLASSKPGMLPLIEERFELLDCATQKGIRVLTLWQDRDEGQLADDFSKSQWPAIRAQLERYLPGVELRAEPIGRSPNLLHRMWRQGRLTPKL
jgi:hypothetical protein